MIHLGTNEASASLAEFRHYLAATCDYSQVITVGGERLMVPSHLDVVGTAVLGHSALTVHQEAVPPPLLGQSVLVALSDVAVQLALLIADGLHILGRGRKRVA